MKSSCCWLAPTKPTKSFILSTRLDLLGFLWMIQGIALSPDIFNLMKSSTLSHKKRRNYEYSILLQIYASSLIETRYTIACCLIDEIWFCVCLGERRGHTSLNVSRVWYTQLVWPKRRQENSFSCVFQWQNLNDLLQTFIEIFLGSHRDKFNRKCDNQHDHPANHTKRAHQVFQSSTQWIQV